MKPSTLGWINHRSGVRTSPDAPFISNAIYLQ
jgi:hypothetical protein